MLLPVLKASFDQITHTLDQLGEQNYREVLNVGAVGTFAVGWLLPRLADFQERYPFIDLRLSTHNNRTDMAAEGFDFPLSALEQAPGTVLRPSPCCQPRCRSCARLTSPPGVKTPADVVGETWLRSYRTDEWTQWLLAADYQAVFLCQEVSCLTLRSPCRSRTAGCRHCPGAAFNVLTPAHQRCFGTTVQHRGEFRRVLADALTVAARNPGHGLF